MPFEENFINGEGALTFLYTPGITSGGPNTDYNKFIIKVTGRDTTAWTYILGCPGRGDPRYGFGNNTGIYGVTGDAPNPLPAYFEVAKLNPTCYTDCSTDKVIRGFIKYATNGIALPQSEIYNYAAPYLWDEGVKDWSYFDYGTEYGLIPAITDPYVLQQTKTCLQSGNCINTTCLSSTAIEVLRRTCVAETRTASSCWNSLLNAAT